MLFDTDIFIWLQRGNAKAAKLIDSTQKRQLSLQSYLELLQMPLNKQQHLLTKSFLKDFSFQILPLTENIGHRAAVYVEEYALSHGMRAGDALIAATAVENGVTLCSGNAKHFKAVRDLVFKKFTP
ncbi:MAG: type II toxin-antitoxin system VapC family toxin [Kiritimatiellia bacterium]